MFKIFVLSDLDNHWDTGMTGFFGPNYYTFGVNYYTFGVNYYTFGV